MLLLDGSIGEGGGQVLRSALTLSMVTRRPFKIDRIRAGREKPGLQRQHLMAVHAARAICNAEVSGDTLGSTQLSFRPRAIRGGAHRFEIESAGSATLVFQTLLPALLRAPEASEVTFGGGTHNPMAPPFDFLERTWLPALAQMGVHVELKLERPGFYPTGGGVFTAKVTPGELGRFEREARGAETGRRAIAMIAGLSESIIDRELRVARDRLGLQRDHISRQIFDASMGPGNVVMVEISFEHGTTVFSGFGERGLRAEQVAEHAIGPALAFAESDAAVDTHLTDQILLPMAVGRGGIFTTTEPSQHARTEAEILRRFLDVDVEITTRDERNFTIELRGADV